MNILIVDDNADKIRSVRALIKADFSEVIIESALTITDAKDKLKSNNKYDLMILDLSMPLRDDSRPELSCTLDFIKTIRVDTSYYLPTHIVGLTAFEDLEREAKSEFQRSLWTILNYKENETSWYEAIKNALNFILHHSTESTTIDVCVLTALSTPEAKAFIKYIDWNWSSLKPLDDTLFGYEGEFVDKNGIKRRVILCSSIEVGMIYTAVITSKLIQLYHPKLMIMAGICAGLEKYNNYGDIVIAQTSWNYNEGKMTIENGELKFLPSVLQSQIDKKLNASLQTFIIENQDNINNINVCFDDKAAINNDLKIVKGAIATGSAVLSDKLTITNILESNRRLRAVDIEIASFYISCELSNTSLDYFAVKSICDFGDPNKDDFYQMYASFTSAKSVEKFITENYIFDD